jgi:anti-anti-sigma factor
MTHLHLGQLEIDVKRDRGVLRLELSGDFELASERGFHESLDGLSWERVSGVVVDLTRLAFIDSAGLRAMLELLSRSRRDGFDLEVVVPPGRVRSVFETTGLDRVLTLGDPADQASADRSPT